MSATTSSLRASSASWPLIQAHLLFWTWTLTTKGLLTVVCVSLITLGLQAVLPDLGMRLWKLPFLAFLEHYEATYRLTLAHLFSVVPLASAWILWHLSLELYLRPDAFTRRFTRWNIDRMQRLVITMAVIIITGDALLFYASFTISGWGSAKFSASAVLATAVYLTTLAFVTFISILLSEKIDNLKQDHHNTKEK